MPSRTPAALKGLYGTPTTAGRSSKLTHRDLGNSDMKALVRVLRGVPFPTDSEADKKYARTTKDAIHSLPSYLRSSSPHISSTEDKETGKVKPDQLCSMHKGLNASLIYSIWSWVRHELDGAIGQFIYPVIMYGGLTEHQKWKARQLEPILELYHTDFDIKQAAPPDHEPIGPGWVDKHGKYTPKFSYQGNQCPACILARIGSDADVVAALLSGIVARAGSKQIGRRDDAKSKRVRFVRYWLKAFDGGEKLIDDAWGLGEVMRRKHKEWKRRVRSHQSDSVQTQEPQVHSAAVRESVIEADISESFDPNYRLGRTPSKRVSKASAMPPSVRESVIGIDISDPFIPSSHNNTAHLAPPPIPPPRPTSSIYSRTTGHITLEPSNHHPAPPMLSQHTLPDPPLQHVHNSHTNITHAPAPSLHSQTAHYSHTSSFSTLSSNSKESWDNLPSYTSTADPFEYDNDINLRPAPLRASNTSREAAREDMYGLPQPNRVSMYAGFGNPYEVEDPYGAGRYGDVSPPGTPGWGDGGSVGRDWIGGDGDGEYDVSPPGSPLVVRKPQTGMTRWSQLY